MEDTKEEKAAFRIQEEDFIMEPTKEGSSFYNLVFMKKTKKRTGEIVIEPGKPMYGLPLDGALRRIIHHKTSKKLAGRNVELREFLVEFQKQYKEMLKLCHETMPEKLGYS